MNRESDFISKPLNETSDFCCEFSLIMSLSSSRLNPPGKIGGYRLNLILNVYSHS